MKHIRLPYLLLALAYCAVIWWLSSQSRPPKPDIGFPLDDKAAHAALFGGLSALVALGLRAAEQPLAPRVQFWAAFAFAAGYGLIDEIHQVFVPLRSPSVLDLVADATGALFVQMLFLLYKGPPAVERST